MSAINIKPGSIPAHLTGKASAAMESFLQGSNFFSGDIPTLQKTLDKRFRLAAPGQEPQTLVERTNSGRDVPLGEIHVVILGVNNGTNGRYVKRYWEKPFDDSGPATPPDCHSSNGITPDETVANPKALKCEGCPFNWQNGGGAPKCRDTVYLACLVLEAQKGGDATIYRLTLAANDFIQKNEKSFNNYMVALRTVGLGPEMVITKLTFNQNSTFPVLDFDYQECLQEQQYKFVTQLQEQVECTKAISKDVKPKNVASITKHQASEAKAAVQAIAAVPAPNAVPNLETALEAVDTPVATKETSTKPSDFMGLIDNSSPTPTKTPEIEVASELPKEFASLFGDKGTDLPF